jgi:endoglycosylceramidase
MSFVKQDIDQLKQNGFNGIRLGIMWSGLEPNKDTFNDTYLDEMTKIVNAAGDAGIYTLI